MTQFFKFVQYTLLHIRKNVNSKSIFQNHQRYCSNKQIKFLLKPEYRSYSNKDYFKISDKFKAPLFFGTTYAFFGWFKKKDEGEEPELITTIKRSILLIQKSEFNKAEQMLHLALKQAQEIQSEEGITYVYDVMANLAFEVGDYEKAEKLFRSVMQRIISTGTLKDDIKITHMSLKMAKIYEVKKDYEKAELGYQHCIDILKKQIEENLENMDIKILWAITLDWYAHFLLSQSNYNKALDYMKKAYDLCVEINGSQHEQTVVLLNDLGSITFSQGKYDEALEYLNKAAEIGNKLPEMEDLASIHINLGNIYIKKGLYDEAKKSCSKGWRLSKARKNAEALEESKACLEEVSKLLTA